MGAKPPKGKKSTVKPYDPPLPISTSPPSPSNPTPKLEKPEKPSTKPKQQVLKKKESPKKETSEERSKISPLIAPNYSTKLLKAFTGTLSNWTGFSWAVTDCLPALNLSLSTTKQELPVLSSDLWTAILQPLIDQTSVNIALFKVSF